MTCEEISQLLDSIARFSNINIGRLPSRVLFPSLYLDILFLRTGNEDGYKKYQYFCNSGIFPIYELKTLTKPKIIFTLS